MTMVLPQVPCCASCGSIEDPLSQEIELHPAIATPFAQLEAVDVAFARARWPGKDPRGCPDPESRWSQKTTLCRSTLAPESIPGGQVSAYRARNLRKNHFHLATFAPWRSPHETNGERGATPNR